MEYFSNLVNTDVFLQIYYITWSEFFFSLTNLHEIIYERLIAGIFEIHIWGTIYNILGPFIYNQHFHTLICANSVRGPSYVSPERKNVE